MIKPKDIPNNQDQPKIDPLPASYKIPIDNQKNSKTPPKINFFYKTKEKEVE
jgi:hypothetical protein